jgi:hypothetical protein
MRHLSFEKRPRHAPPLEGRGLKSRKYLFVETGLRLVFFISISSFSCLAKNRVKIYNALGIEFTPPQTPPLEGRGLKIDISNLQSGVYFIKIGGKFEKFVKM